MSDNSDIENEGATGSNLQPAKQALAQKRDVRQLNTRLEMLVRSYQDNTRQTNTLKQSLAKQEVEFRNKLKQQDVSYKSQIDKLRKENENVIYNNKRSQQELNNAMNSKKECEERLISSESRAASLISENEAIKQELNRLKDETDLLRNQYASIKYKYESFESEKKSFMHKLNEYKNKNEEYLRSLTAQELQLKSSSETYQRVIIDKNDEIDKIRLELKDITFQNNSQQQRLRKEFDNKLADFVQKREEQYKQEKDEWMRIFKEEFNRKLRSFKEANYDLSHTNKKQENEIKELRTRISKLKQQKVELELQNRNIENESDKIRTDLDELRKTKDNELKVKNAKIVELRDRFKAKELQFDELCGIKLQLDSEIELYRNILNEAEQAENYISPLRPLYKLTGNGGRKRKRVRYSDNNNNNTTTPIQAAIDNSNSNNNDNNDNNVCTPGIERALITAEKDLKSMDVDTDVVDQKEPEELIEKYMDDNDIDIDVRTPGYIDGSELEFSDLDLLAGMIEIRNTGNKSVSMNKYILSNGSGKMNYPLSNIILKSNDKIRIYIGDNLQDKMDLDCSSHKDIIGDYQGQYIFWPINVWNGSNDEARLLNNNKQEIAKVQISPDMVQDNQRNCIMM